MTCLKCQQEQQQKKCPGKNALQRKKKSKCKITGYILVCGIQKCMAVSRVASKACTNFPTLRASKCCRGLFPLQSQWIQCTRHSTQDTSVCHKTHITSMPAHRKPFITSFNRTHVWRKIWAIKYLVSIQVKVHRWHISIILNSNTGGRRFAKDVFHLRLHYRHSHAKQDSMHLMAPPS